MPLSCQTVLGPSGSGTWADTGSPSQPASQRVREGEGSTKRKATFTPVDSPFRCLLPSAGNAIRDPLDGDPTPPLGMWFWALPNPAFYSPGCLRTGTSRGR